MLKLLSSYSQKDLETRIYDELNLPKNYNRQEFIKQVKEKTNDLFK